MSQLDDIIRGQIAAYGNVRGGTVKKQKTGAQLGHGNIGGARNRGKPAYPDQTNQLAPKANEQPDEGFQVQSEPMEDTMGLGEGKWLRGLAAAGAMAAAQPTSVDFTSGRDPNIPTEYRAPTVDDHIAEASKETGVQPEIIRAIIHVESTGDPTAVSYKGARGYMQLMPGTATEMGVDDPHDPRQNIIGGARYLQRLATIFKGNLTKTIGAYNAGVGGIRGKTVEEWPAETQDYLKKVLRKLPRGFNVVKYKPITAFKAERISEPLAMGEQLPEPIQERGGAGVSRFNTDLSGKQERTPGLDDAERKNRLPGDPVSLGGLSEVIGGIIYHRLREDRATQVGVTGGRFQPFHKGHAAVIRKLAASLPKVIIFTDPGGVFSPSTVAALIKASLPDIWDKIEMYPGDGNLQRSAQKLAGQEGTTLNRSSNVSYHQMPEDDEISAKRIREALQDDDKDMVRKMLDPHVSTEPATFEQIYAQMRRELGRSGKDTVEVVTDAPVSGPQPDEIREEAKKHSGTFLGLKLDKKSAQSLAREMERLGVEGHESPDDMHITLFYKKGLDADQAAKVEKTFNDVIGDRMPFEFEVKRLETFDPSESSDWKVVLYAPVVSDTVQSVRKELIDRLEKEGIEPDKTFEFHPHITLKYFDPDDSVPRSIRNVKVRINDYVFKPGEPVNERVISELGMGASETNVGFTRGGAFGHSAWSSYNPRNKADDGDLQYQQMLRSPSTRMLNMTNHGVPNDHMPGEMLDHHLGSDEEDTLTNPTDLSEIIAAQFKKLL